MAKKIFKGIGGLLGFKKKPKAPAPEPQGPIIKQLNPAEQAKVDPRRRAVSGRTILEDRLGGADKLGG